MTVGFNKLGKIDNKIKKMEENFKNMIIYIDKI